MSRARSASLDEYLTQEWTFRAETPDRERDALVALIAKWASPGEWLDLGCGPFLPVWPLFAPGRSFLTGLDRDPEVGSFLRGLAATPNETTPPAIQAALEFASQCRADIAMGTPLALSVIREVVTDDVLNERPDWRERFDTIVQIGCFGCLRSLNELSAALSLTLGYLRPGGSFLSAIWIAGPSHRESLRWGGDGGLKIDAGGYADAMTSAGFLIQARLDISPEDDVYADVCLIAATRA